MRICRLIFCATLVLAAAARAQSVVTVVPDADASIYSEGNNANGSGTQLFHGRNGGNNLRRGLLRFPVDTVIPAGATITSVEFELKVNQSNFNNLPHALHRLQASWTEGPSSGTGSGGPQSVGEVTWNWRRYLVDPWVTPGGDFAATPSASFNLLNSGRQTIPSTPQLVADVQGWVDAPSSNFGFVLIGGEATLGGAYRSASREDTANAPTLRITYQWPSIAAPYGFSCGTFDLQAVGAPALGNLTFALAINAALPANAPTLLFATAPLTSPLIVSNCPLNLDPATIFAAVPTDPSGTLVLPLASTATTLLGSRAFVQAAGISQFSSNLVLSNGLLVQIGN